MNTQKEEQKAYLLLKIFLLRTDILAAIFDKDLICKTVVMQSWTQQNYRQEHEYSN